VINNSDLSIVNHHLILEEENDQFDLESQSGAVDSDAYLLKTYRDIEMNPEAAAMVDRPEAYPWSSYGGNVWGDPIVWFTPHKEDWLIRVLYK